MNYLKKSAFCAFVISGFTAFGQNNLPKAIENPIWEKSTIHQSEEIKSLVRNSVSQSIEKPTIKGYRIQLFSESGANVKTKATAVQSEFIKNYPTIPAYIVFESPNFKIKAGDFRSQIEAQKYLKQIKSSFPGAFIVTDDIMLPSAE